MYIYKVKKRKACKTKCKPVKSVEYYVNGGLIEAELVFECKPKVKRRQPKRSAREVIADWLLFG